MIEAIPLSNQPFGAEITGVDFSGPVSDDDIRTVIQHFYNHAIIIIRDQRLDLERYEWLVGQFGQLHHHLIDHLRLKDHPAILNLSNIFEDGKPIGGYHGASFWHTDVAYEDPGNSATIVYGHEWPEGGCPTYFCDSRAAYDALSDTMKKQIDALTVLHHYGNRDDMIEDSTTSAEKLQGHQKAQIQNVFHPLVKAHPFTGRKALYGVAGSSFGIVGMPDDEAISLLDELKVHALQPQFIANIDYHPGDIGAWDTYSTLHKATTLKPAEGTHDRRLVWRISVKGHPPLMTNEAVSA
jgi:taurine dioxygenase